MRKFRFLNKDKMVQLPKTSGIYAFKKGQNLLYIGKAKDIKERVKNHFQPLRLGPGQATFKDSLFIPKTRQIGYIETDSEIEALLLESQLIKKYRPKYNVMWRDDKNYFYIGITKEDFPRVFWTHQIKKSKTQNPKSKTNQKSKILNSKTLYIGPFIEGVSLKRTLAYLRRVFPYYTSKTHPKTLCQWCHLNLCPGPNPDKKEYQKNIKNLILVLKGKRQSVLNNLKKEMKRASDLENFEKAAKIRDQIWALEKIISHTKIFEPQVSLEIDWPKIQKILQKTLNTKKRIFRIEAYDVSNIQGKEATGSMVTFIKGKPDKNFYRKFKIKVSGKPNDIAMLKECLIRRFKHLEWPLPDLILIDGGISQLNAAIKVKNHYSTSGFEYFKIVALAKKRNQLFIEPRKKPVLLKKLPREIFNLILQLRDEAHRFAIAYHRRLRQKDLIGK